MNSDSNKPQRVLVFRPGSIGDTLMAIPALNYFRALYPKSHFSLLTNSPRVSGLVSASSILEEGGMIEETFYYPPALCMPGVFLKLSQALVRSKFDLCLYLGPLRETSALIRYKLFFLALGISTVQGLPWQGQERHVVNAGLYEHEANRILRQIGGENMQLSETALWSFPLPTGCIDRAAALRKITGPSIVLCIGGKDPAKHWGGLNWSSLVQKLSASHANYTLIIVGSHLDASEAAQLLTYWPGSSRNLCGELSVLESMAVIGNATCMVSHDTGPLHMAALMNVPCVALFSDRELPGVWFPFIERRIVFYQNFEYRGMDVRRHEYIVRNIEDIPVSEVARAVCELLSQG